MGVDWLVAPHGKVLRIISGKPVLLYPGQFSVLERAVVLAFSGNDSALRRVESYDGFFHEKRISPLDTWYRMAFVKKVKHHIPRRVSNLHFAGNILAGLRNGLFREPGLKPQTAGK